MADIDGDIDHRCQRWVFFTLFNHSSLIITLANDVESNPGPRKIKFPCMICKKAAKFDAVACDDCNQWYHIKCMDMNEEVYFALANSSLSWQCFNCGIPNFNTSLFDSPTSDLSSALGDSLNSSSPCNSPGAPISCSSPKGPIFKPTEGLRSIIVNFQSIKNKKAEFLLMLDRTNPDIIFGNETWLNSEIQNQEILPPEYTAYRKDRPDGYGGTLIGIRKSFTCHELKVNSANVSTELVAIKVEIPRSKPLIVVAAYRPPYPDYEYSTDLCETIEDLASRHKKNVFWLGGDFNLPDIDWKTNNITGNDYPRAINERFLQMIGTIHCEQLVTSPTRFENTLDLFITNRPSLTNRLEIMPAIGRSDHETVFVNSSLQAPRRKPQARRIDLWKRANTDEMKKDASAYQTTFLEKFTVSDSVDEMWDNFSTSMAKIQKDHVPTKISSTRFHQPWINTNLKRLSRRKRRSFRKKNKTKKKKDHARHRKLKAELQRETRQAYNNFIKDTISPDAKGNPKKFWGFIKNKRVDDTGIAPLRNRDGIIYSNSEMKAKILNDQFSSVFNSDEDDNIPDLGPSPHPTMENIKVTTRGVFLLLDRMNPHKATGPDGISAQILKVLAEEIAPILSLLFQASLDQGTVPQKWKEAHVVPIFKKGDKNKAANYRPISLTSICSKCLEHIVRSNVMDHFDELEILTDSQHGFRKKRSTVSQLITTTHDLFTTLEKGGVRDVVFLDYSKAFDKVPHKRLLHKLKFYGIRESTNQWISSFLENRTQLVLVDGKASPSAPVLSGVPQGTVLGPLLFLAYINDLPDCITPGSDARLYADDSALSREIKTTDDEKALQADLNELQSWEQKWKMEFNPDKCQAMRVTLKRNQANPSYTIHGQELEAVSKAKYLGLTISKTLSWSDHIAATSKKAESARSFLARNINSCTSEVKKQCYTTLVRPILEYASEVWDPHQATNIQRLERTQRRAARFITGKYDRQASVSDMLTKIKLPTLRARRAAIKVTTFYKGINRQLDIPTFHLKPSARCTRGNQIKYHQISCRLDITNSSFFPDAIRLWNRLPQEVAAAPTLESFKSRLQCHSLRP